MSQQKRSSKKFFKIVVKKEKPNYRGDINLEVRKYVEEDKQRYGIIVTKDYDKQLLIRLVKYLMQIPHINWLYITDTEVQVFSLNVNGFNTEVDKTKFVSKINEILGTSIGFRDVFIYPVRNVLNDLTPFYPKDKKLNAGKKQQWDYGKLGKKEMRRKYENWRRKILYSNLKR